MKRLVSIIGMVVLLLAAMTGTALAGNTAETATPIGINTTVSGNLTSSSDKNWYSFELSAAGVIRISFEHEVIASTSSYWSICLYDELGLTVYDDLRSIGKENTTGEEIGLPAGKYRLRVTSASGYSDKAYSLKVNYTKSSYWEKELNNSYDKASSISLNTTYSGSLMSSGDYDWYSFVLPNDGVIQLSFDHPVIASTGTYWAVNLYDELGLKVYDQLTVKGNENAVGEEIGLPAGKYCLKILQSNSFSDKTYSFRVRYTKSSVWEKELNDGQDTATPIALDTKYSGSLMSSNDKDWYSFELLSDGKIQISVDHEKLTSTGTYWAFNLYDELGLTLYDQLIVKGNANVVGEEIGLPAGKYCLKAIQYNNYTNTTYSFKVSYTKSSLWEKELNNSRDAATPISANKKYKGSLLSSSDIDWYSFNLAKDGTIQLYFDHPDLSTVNTYWSVTLYDEYETKTFGSFSVKGNENFESSGIVLQAGKYTVKVQQRNNYSDSTYTLRVKAPGITQQPTSVTVPVGNVAKFSVETYGVAPFTYQWQYRKNSSDTWKTSGQSGNKTATLSVATTVGLHGYQFRCVVTDGNGTKYYSAAATLTLRPKITTWPKDTTVAPGSTAEFTIAATGKGPLKYQWQYRKNETSEWKASGQSGNKTATLKVAATAALNGYQFRCYVTDANGQKSYTNTVTLTVSPRITTQPVSKTVTAGATAKFTVTAAGKGTITYQWQYRKNSSSTWTNSGQSGNKTKTLSVATRASLNGYQFRCIVTDSAGRKSISNTVTLTVK